MRKPESRYSRLFAVSVANPAKVPRKPRKVTPRVCYETLVQQLCQGAFLRPNNGLARARGRGSPVCQANSSGCVALARHESQHRLNHLFCKGTHVACRRRAELRPVKNGKIEPAVARAADQVRRRRSGKGLSIVSLMAIADAIIKKCQELNVNGPLHNIGCIRADSCQGISLHPGDAI